MWRRATQTIARTCSILHVRTAHCFVYHNDPKRLLCNIFFAHADILQSCIFVVLVASVCYTRIKLMSQNSVLVQLSDPTKSLSSSFPSCDCWNNQCMHDLPCIHNGRRKALSSAANTDISFLSPLPPWAVYIRSVAICHIGPLLQHNTPSITHPSLLLTSKGIMAPRGPPKTNAQVSV